jgi:hypothetical protein
MHAANDAQWRRRRVSRLIERSGTRPILLCMLGRHWQGPLRPSWRARRRASALARALLDPVLQRQAHLDVQAELKRSAWCSWCWRRASATG